MCAAGSRPCLTGRRRTAAGPRARPTRGRGRAALPTPCLRQGRASCGHPIADVSALISPAGGRDRPGVALYYFDRRANWRGGWPKMGRDRLRQGRVDRACRADEGGREHRVPLSKAALAILRAALREDGNPFVFIGGNKGSAQQHGDARAAAAAHGAFLFQIGSEPGRLRATTCASIVIGVCGSHCHAGPGIWDSPVGLRILGRNEWLLPRTPCRAQAVAIGAIP